MNKEDFLSRLFSKYASNFDRVKIQVLLDDYRKYLSDRIDFEKTYDYLTTHWTKSSMPQVADILENAVYKAVERCTNSLYWTIKGFRQGWGEYEFACEMTQSLREAIENLNKRGFSYISNNKEEIKSKYGIL